MHSRTYNRKQMISQHTHTHTNTFHTPAGLRFCVRWTTRSSRAFPSENGTTVYFPATPNRCGAQRALLARIRPLLLLWSLTIYCCAGHHHHQPTPALLLTFNPGKHRTQCKHFALCFAQAQTHTLTHSWLLLFLRTDLRYILSLIFPTITKKK